MINVTYTICAKEMAAMKKTEEYRLKSVTVSQTSRRYYRNAEKKLAREQRKLSKMQKGSNNRNKQRLKMAKLHEKISNQRKDFLHKQSRQITNAYA